MQVDPVRDRVRGNRSGPHHACQFIQSLPSSRGVKIVQALFQFQHLDTPVVVVSSSRLRTK
jgi:hypothetical protein